MRAQTRVKTSIGWIRPGDIIQVKIDNVIRIRKVDAIENPYYSSRKIIYHTNIDGTDNRMTSIYHSTITTPIVGFGYRNLREILTSI